MFLKIIKHLLGVIRTWVTRVSKTDFLLARAHLGPLNTSLIGGKTGQRPSWRYGESAWELKNDCVKFG